ncbi:MAG: CAP domain-containing protein [Clostridia bacterium]|nr:CAP domain-containing protein [Clostridia bacterium]
MKRRVFSTLMVLVMVFVMTIGSTALTWAGTGSAALESSIRKALESYEAKNETSDGDLMFFVYDLLPNDMKDAEIEIYRQKVEAATETSGGSISFYVAINGTLIPDEDSAPLVAKIKKLPKKEPLSSPELDEDWSLACKAIKALKVSNDLTADKIVAAVKKVVKNGSACKISDNFYKRDATLDNDGTIQGYVVLTLKGKTREAGCAATIPALKTWPKKGISINKEEWQILREVNRERAKKGLQLVTMVAPLQAACDTRGVECSKYLLEAHKRPDGSSYATAIPTKFGRNYVGENLYKCDPRYKVTQETTMVGWMNSAPHRRNILNSSWNYIGIGMYKQVGVQIFASRNTPIVKYTTSTGKTTFNSIADMEKAYLIATDSAGRKSYLPLNTDYMKKVKGGYTLKLYSRKTVKITVKQSASEFTYSDVAEKDKAIVKWAAKNKLVPPLTKTDFSPNTYIKKGEILYAIHRINGSPRDNLKGITNQFLDLGRDTQYYTAALWGKKQNFYDYGFLEPERGTPRGYALYYVWLSVGSPKAKKGSTFTDFRKEVFYAQAVAWAQEKGIIVDNGDHKFGGDDHICSRVELARYLYYAYNKKNV